MIKKFDLNVYGNVIRLEVNSKFIEIEYQFDEENGYLLFLDTLQEQGMSLEKEEVQEVLNCYLNELKTEVNKFSIEYVKNGAFNNVIAEWIESNRVKLSRIIAS